MHVRVAEMRSAIVVALLVGIIPSVASAQISTPAPQDSPPAEQSDKTSGDPASEASVTDGEEATQPRTPQRSALSPADNVELQRRFNELRRELLDDEREEVHGWLNVVGIVLTFFGIVVAIAGFLGYRRFREIEREAGRSAAIVTEHAKTAAARAATGERYLQETKEIRNSSREILQGDTQIAGDREEGTQADGIAGPDPKASAINTAPDEGKPAGGTAGPDPKASAIDTAVARAVALEKESKPNAAAEEWRAIARVTEGSDNELAARAWFSVGRLIDDQKPEERVVAFDNSIRLSPASSGSYNNRGVQKHNLGRYKAAILDYDEAIRLNPESSMAFSNRGNAKRMLDQSTDAMADYDEAIRLKPDSATPRFNRGTLNLALGHREEARSDLNRVLQLAQEPDDADVAARAEQKLRELDAEARS